MIINEKMLKKLEKLEAKRKKRFKRFKLPFAEKTIRNAYSKEAIEQKKAPTSLIIYSSNFKGKLDADEIERALKIFVENGEIVSFSQKNIDSKDGYLLIFSTENRSQSGFLKRSLEEIDLNNVNTEPIQPDSTSNAEEPATTPEDESKPF